MEVKNSLYSSPRILWIIPEHASEDAWKQGRKKQERRWSMEERTILKTVARQALNETIKKYAKILGVKKSFLLELIKETINEMKD